MSSSDYFFEDLENEAATQRPDAPIWTHDLEDDANEKNVIKWLTGELNWLKSENKERLQRIQKNLARYKGIQYQSQEARADLRERPEYTKKKNDKVVINNIYDAIRSRVSKIVQFKPAISVLPTTDDFNDINGAQVAKLAVDNLWYETSFEEQISPDVAVNTEIMGEAYLWIDWDPNAGDTNPEWKAAMNKGMKKIPLLDDNGQQEKDENNNPVFIEKEVKNGDVGYSVEYATEVLLHRPPSGKYKDVDYVFKRKVMNIYEARAKWPDKATKIKASNKQLVYDYEKMKMRDAKNEVVVWEFYHRNTEFMGKGRKICFTDDCILSSTDNPFEDGELPFERYSGIDLPGEINAVSIIERIKDLCGVYNNLTNMIIRNQSLTSHPKWAIQAGSVKLDELGNDITIMQVKGPIMPQLIQCNPTPAEVFNFRERVKQEILVLAAVQGMSHGELPPGVTANVALQFVAEQENERWNQDILKWNDFVKRVAVKSLSRMAQFYDPADKRFVRLLGKDNAWRIQFLDIKALSNSYDVRVQNSSAFPATKTSRINTMLDLAQRFPAQVPAEQILDMFDMAQYPRFVNQATVSVKAAEAENEKMLSGQEIVEPQDIEDHIQHWNSHIKEVRNWKFKNQTPKEIQQLLRDHIMTHEMLMVERARRSQTYDAQLEALQGFPAIYVPEEYSNNMNPLVPQAGQGQPGGLPQGSPNDQQLAIEQAMSNQPQGIAPSQEQQLAVNPNTGIGEPQMNTVS